VGEDALGCGSLSGESESAGVPSVGGTVRMVGEGLPDHPADDRVVVHLLKGCVEAGREGKRAKQHGGCNSHEGGWMDGSQVLFAIVDSMIGVCYIRVLRLEL
jgi:hypothetical protein